MSLDTGTQFAYLAPAERVLAAADIHMSACDAPTVFECAECTRKITKYRKYLAALTAAGWSLLPPGGQNRHPVSDLVSAAQRLRDSVDALPQLPVQGELEPWRYFTDRGTAPPGEHMDMLDLGPRSLILGWGDDELRPAEGRHVALTASPRTVLLLADLLDEISSTAGDDAHRLNEIRAAADALASSILHTDQPEG